VFGAVLLAEVFQVGVSVSPDSIAFRLSRLDLGKGLKRLFGLDGEESGFPARLAYDVLKTALTVFGGVALGALVLISCRGLYLQPAIDVQGCVAAVGIAIREELSWLIPVFLVIGSGDLLVARFRRMQRLRMDLDEFRREMRENEGNPELRGLRKQLHQELVVRNLVQGVRQASLVVLGKRRVH
jgi:type III secretion protein U